MATLRRLQPEKRKIAAAAAQPAAGGNARVALLTEQPSTRRGYGLRRTCLGPAASEGQNSSELRAFALRWLRPAGSASRGQPPVIFNFPLSIFNSPHRGDRLSVSLASPEILPLGKMQASPRLFVSLASPKILSLGRNKPCARSTFRIFGFAQDTPARQNASKLAFALAYSYLCPLAAPEWGRGLTQ